MNEIHIRFETRSNPSFQSFTTVIQETKSVVLTFQDCPECLMSRVIKSRRHPLCLSPTPYHNSVHDIIPDTWCLFRASHSSKDTIAFFERPSAFLPRTRHHSRHTTEMNRNRASAPADRAAQNAQTLKALVKLEGNKVCADCKRNKHPRWASWNLGVFVCIRCSGIHRGMGTHISRVKSVDLDAWTDEQLQSVLKWGNTRANKYWEAKLQAGHVPSEAKMENFIRTKYESKRWVMEGPMPDPSTLGDDDDVPLNVVQEKAKIERSASQKQSAGTRQSIQAPPQPAQSTNVDLFGDFDPPARPSTTDVISARPPPPVQQAAPQAVRQSDNLMGLDFFGPSQSAGIGRPSSAAANPTQNNNSRNDLKSSILSLYASAPKPQPAPQPTHDRQPSFGGMSSAPPPRNDAFGGLADAFGGMNFSTTSSAPAKASSTVQPSGSSFGFPSMSSPPKPSTSSFSGLGFPSSVPTKSPPTTAKISSPPLSGGNFFAGTSTKPPAPMPAQAQMAASNALNFSFTQQTSPPPAPRPATTSIPADLFGDDGFNDFTSPSATISSKPPISSPPLQSPTNFKSAFNLSSPTTTAAKPAPLPAAASQPNTTMFDPWGASDNNAWGAPEPAKAVQPKIELGSVPSKITPNDISGGWGAPISSVSKPTAAQPTVTADEDFGGWASAATPAATKPGGNFGASDPFDNPWG